VWGDEEADGGSRHFMIGKRKVPRTSRSWRRKEDGQLRERVWHSLEEVVGCKVAEGGAQFTARGVGEPWEAVLGFRRGQRNVFMMGFRREGGE